MLLLIPPFTFATEKADKEVDKEIDKEMVERLEKTMLSSEHLLNDLKDFEGLDTEEIATLAENKKKY